MVRLSNASGHKHGAIHGPFGVPPFYNSDWVSLGFSAGRVQIHCPQIAVKLSFQAPGPGDEAGCFRLAVRLVSEGFIPLVVWQLYRQGTQVHSTNLFPRRGVTLICNRSNYSVVFWMDRTDTRHFIGVSHLGLLCPISPNLLVVQIFLTPSSPKRLVDGLKLLPSFIKVPLGAIGLELKSAQESRPQYHLDC